MGHLQQLLKIIKRNKKVTVVKQPVVLTPYQPLTDQDRFNDSYEPTDTCWNWIGTLDRYGYGKFKVGQRTVKAHRYSYRLHHGEFNEQLHVLHRCDNPRCVNPDHLFLGTNRDNVADRETKNRHGIIRRQLTAAEKSAITQSALHGQSLKSLSEKYHVHISTIRRVIKRTDSHFERDPSHPATQLLQ